MGLERFAAGHMGEEEQVLHIAELLSRRIQDGQDEQMAVVRHKSEEEEAVAAAAHGASREHGSFQQQMVVAMAPVAYRARGAHSRY